MNHFKIITGIATTICAYVVASSLSAATIPAGTAVSIRTTSQISERDPVGRTFTGRVDQDVVVNGATVLKAGAAVTGRVTASRASSRPGRGSAPLSVALTSITANGGSVAIKTGSVATARRDDCADRANEVALESRLATCSLLREPQCSSCLRSQSRFNLRRVEWL